MRIYRKFPVKYVLFLSIFILASAIQGSWGQIPRTISYQGTLTQPDGAIAPDGDYSLTFRIYDVDTGGTELWSEDQTLTVEKGVFNASLGSVTSIELAFDKPYWLGIAVNNGAELTPRIALTASPYSLNAQSGGEDAQWTVSNDDIYRLNGNVGIGTTSPQTKLEVFGGLFAGLKCKADLGYDHQFSSTGEARALLGISLKGTTTSITASGFPSTEQYTSLILRTLHNGHGNDHMIINSLGNVGIGTTSPEALLDINGTDAETEDIPPLRITAPTFPYISLQRTDEPNDGDVVGALFFRTKPSEGGKLTYSVGSIQGIATNPAGGTRRGGLSFLTANNNGQLAERVMIDENGRVHLKTGGIIFPDGTIQNTAQNTAGEGSPWNPTGDGIYYDKKVGIGTAAPKTRLQVGDDALFFSEDGLWLKSNGGSIVFGPYDGSRIETATAAIAAGWEGGANPSIEMRVTRDGHDTSIKASYDGKIYLNGVTQTKVLEITGGADLSEQFEVKGTKTPDSEASEAEIKPGMVVCIDAENPGELMVSAKAYDRTVAGIISGAGGVKTGMLMGQAGTVVDGSHPVTLTGRVYCLADASYGEIQPGDLLTTSDTPGHAMKVTDHTRAQGAILGKAMSELDNGRGLVLVLVMPQ